MNFYHKKLDCEFPKLIAVDSPHGRLYNVGDKYYPSVTTVLGTAESSGLDAWKERVGHEAAEKAKNYGAARGTMLHSLVERYINNETIIPFKENPIVMSLFAPLREYLKTHLTEVWAQEATVYSDILRVAGRTDVIGIFDNEPTVVDFKTSNKTKKIEWISNYLMQCAAYASCICEKQKLSINKYAICIVNEDLGTLDVFTGRCSDHVKDFYNLRKKFDEQIPPSSYNPGMLSSSGLGAGCNQEATA